MKSLEIEWEEVSKQLEGERKSLKETIEANLSELKTLRNGDFFLLRRQKKQQFFVNLFWSKIRV